MGDVIVVATFVLLIEGRDDNTSKFVQQYLQPEASFNFE
jgi:hypothetical protein